MGQPSLPISANTYHLFTSIIFSVVSASCNVCNISPIIDFRSSLGSSMSALNQCRLNLSHGYTEEISLYNCCNLHNHFLQARGTLLRLQRVFDSTPSFQLLQIVQTILSPFISKMPFAGVRALNVPGQHSYLSPRSRQRGTLHP
jgi:hypothetical protein